MSVDRVLVLHRDDGPELDLVEGGGSVRAILWPGVGARSRSMHRIVLEPGARTREQRHRGEAVYAVLAGSGEIVDGEAGARAVGTGSMVHVDADTGYVIVAGPGGLEAVGGPAPVDPDLYERKEA